MAKIDTPTLIKRYSQVVKKKNKVKDFINTLAINPKLPELNRAFREYEKETGKSRNDMTQKEIMEWVQKTR